MNKHIYYDLIIFIGKFLLFTIGYLFDIWDFNTEIFFFSWYWRLQLSFIIYSSIISTSVLKTWEPKPNKKKFYMPLYGI